MWEVVDNQEVVWFSGTLEECDDFIETFTAEEIEEYGFVVDVE